MVLKKEKTTKKEKIKKKKKLTTLLTRLWDNNKNLMINQNSETNSSHSMIDYSPPSVNFSIIQSDSHSISAFSTSTSDHSYNSNPVTQQQLQSSTIQFEEQITTQDHHKEKGQSEKPELTDGEVVITMREKFQQNFSSDFSQNKK